MSCYDDYLIPHLEGLDEKREKGRGAFGAVYEVKLNGLPCIAKGLHDILLDYQVLHTDKQAIRKKFLDECVLLSKLKHPNIVQFLGVYHTNNDEYLVMERMYMDLHHCLHEYHNIPLSIKSSILQDVSYGLLHLHSLNPPVIHRDLTASNVLLTESMRAKIADLGVSKIFDLKQLQKLAMLTTAPGTPAYMPPEALTPEPLYGLKLDIFSFGVLTLFTAIQEFPTPHELGVNDITAEIKMNQTMQIARRKHWIAKMDADHPFHSIVSMCIKDCPDLRPTAKELSEAASNLCSQHKKEWNNILELHGQWELSNSQLQKTSSELKMVNIELQQTNSKANDLKTQLDLCKNEVTEYITKEKELLAKNNDIMLEFDAKQKRLEDEILAWKQTSKHLTTQVEAYKVEWKRYCQGNSATKSDSMLAPKPASVMDRTLTATPTSIKPIPSSSNAPEDASRQRSSTLSDIFRRRRHTIMEISSPLPSVEKQLEELRDMP